VVLDQDATGGDGTAIRAPLPGGIERTGLSSAGRRVYAPHVAAASYHPPPIRNLEAPALEAIVEVMFLAAFADGDFGEEEHVHFLTSIESLTDRTLSGEMLEQLVARITRDLRTEGRAARLAAVKERLPDPGARKAALALAIQLTAADGIIRTSERELIVEAAEALGIPPDTAADLVARLAPEP
jgi:tellurite resistance protein